VHISILVKGLILAGGHGTRLRPLTFTGNKHMIPIANKPMLEYALDNLTKAGIREIGIVLGPINEGVRESIGNGSKFGLNVTYISQPDPRGLAHALLLSEYFLKDEPFVMHLGDNLLKQGVTPIIDTYRKEGTDCVICVTPVKNSHQYGIVELDSSGRIFRLVEKPLKSRSNLALVGIYLFNHTIFEAARSIKPSWRNELEITDAIQILSDRGKKIGVKHVDGWWKDTGRPDDLLEANQLVLDDMIPTVRDFSAESSRILGKVSLGRNTIVRSNTTIKGPVVIGDNCEIGPNVYVGPYTSIGDNVKILSGEVEGSIIMDTVLIHCNKRIVNSIIGRQSRLESSEELPSSGLQLIVGDSTVCHL
jgi:glucose-1-phosphate thymidylyltransferase